MNKILSVLILLVCLSLNARQENVSVSQENDPIVTTSYGVVRGTSDGDVESFKGIPYAAPPVGEYRWRPPQPVQPWQGILDAREFCSICAQAGMVPHQGQLHRDHLKTVSILISGGPQVLSQGKNFPLWCGSMEALLWVEAVTHQEMDLPEKE